MDIVHDFFNQNGGGENLVKSISKLSKSKIHTAYSKNKQKFIFQSKINQILKLNVFFVFIYFIFFFKLHSKDIILFSGNHCSFSIKKCVAKKKYLYAHSLPKSLFSELYIDTERKPVFNFLKKKLIKKYYYNLISLDKIFFNSIKTKNKFLYAFPNLDKKVNLEIIYPFSDLEFIEEKESNTNKKNKKKNYYVINSRHQSSKNIIHILLLMKPILDRYKDIKLYITQEGSETKNLKNLYPENKQIIYTGYLKFEDYKKLLFNCNAVIFPSRDEDFGISALDAYNLNVPVLIQKNCGFSEILHEKYNFFYNDNNFSDIIEKTLNQDNKNPYTNKINLKNLLIEKLQNI